MNRARTCVVALIFLLGSIAAVASAEIYRWIDESGEMHLTSELSQVPAQHRDAAAADARKRSDSTVNVYGGGAPEAPPAKAEQPAPATASARPGGHDETWWRNQSVAHHRAVDDAKADYDAAAAEEDGVSGEIYGRTRRAGRAKGHAAPRRRAARGAALSDDGYDEPTAAELKTTADRAERDLADFEEQARRAGVPPGWLR